MFFLLVSFSFMCSLPGYYPLKQYIYEKQNKIIDNYALMKVRSSATGLSFIIVQIPDIVWTCVCLSVSMNLIYSKWYEVVNLFVMLFLYSLSLQLTALIFGTLSRRVISGSTVYMLFTTLPAALMLSMDARMANKVACSVLGAVRRLGEDDDVISEMQCVSLGKKAQIFSLVALLSIIVT